MPPLLDDIVQVWRVDLAQPLDVEDRLRDLLSDDERARADRFYFPHLRTHYISARGALRILLGGLSGREPAELTFAYAQHGKPFLPESELQFNVSHSGEVGLIAVAHGRRIGVDVELIRNLPDAEDVARRFFAPSEVEEYLSLPIDRRPEGFYNAWTRKEAFIKAVGDGLSYPLDRFTVSLLPGEPARLRTVKDDPSAVRRWKLIALESGDGYAGALLAELPDWELDYRVYCF
jgi:4'-phosphopantetheinyl transferase